MGRKNGGPSSIRVDGNSAFIFLKEGIEATIDAADIPLVENRRWRLMTLQKGHTYACSGQTPLGNFTTLHRLLLQPPQTLQVDHKDGDGLNNRRNNIRIATVTQNNANIAVTKRNKLGIKGVVLDSRGRYAATIKANKKSINLGYYKTAEEAGAAYKGAAKVLFREFARS